MSLSEAFFSQPFFVGSAEPIYALTVWTGASLNIDKDIYFSVFNVILLCLITLNCLKYRISTLVIFLLLTNFYVIVLLTAAERLKLSFILILLAVYFEGRVRKSLLFVAPAAHFQTLILYAGVIFSYIPKPARHVKRSTLLRFVKYAIIASPPLIAFLFYFQETLISKFLIYFSLAGRFSELIQWAIISVFGLVILRDRWGAACAFASMGCMILLLGGGRVNMILFFVLFILLQRERKLTHPIMLVILLYLSIKSVDFISNIFTYGHALPYYDDFE